MMRTMGKLVMGLLAGLVLTTGCDGADDQQFLDSQDPLPSEVIRTVVDGQELVTYRQVWDNGISLNGISLNGISLNGISLNGPDLTDWMLNELPDIIGIDLADDGSLEVVKPNGREKVLNNDQVRVKYELEGDSYQMQISELEDGNGIQFMRVQWRMDGEGTWNDACVDGQGNGVKAVLISGAYDPVTGERTNNADDAMWACRGTSVAKATEMGYDENDPHHRALVLAFRADYCGDGIPHTETGTPIDIASDDGLHEHETTWDVEAGWSDGGVVCLNDPRKAFVDASALPCQPPPCTQELLDGAMFVTRATQS